MTKTNFFRLVGLVLLSASLFQIIAAGIAAFFWIVTGDWRSLILPIIVIAFWINLPVTYFIGQRLFTGMRH